MADNIASFKDIYEYFAAKPAPAEYPQCCAWHAERGEDYRGMRCR